MLTLTALKDLLFDSFDAHRILVIAPLRVARDTWLAEAAKWDHLQNLICSVAVGTEAERRAALEQPADIYIINRENVQWLIEESRLPFNYDTIVVDELSSFKSHQAKRFKSLMKVRPRVKRIVGLTGTPSSNGLMDLWAEFRLLDMGQRLGRFITHYRDEFFQPDKHNGQIIFSYKLKPGAEQRIYDKISDITISIIDLQNEINRDIDTLVDLKREIMGVIKAVANPDFQTLLEKRYLCFLSWEKIAVDMGYDLRYIHKLHTQALEECKIPVSYELDMERH